MGQLSKQVLPVIDESMFYCLLEGPGSVWIDIVVIESYFLPFVSFRVCADVPREVRYGLILRNGTDLLAAESVHDLVGLLREMTGWRASLQINAPEPAAPPVWGGWGARRNLKRQLQ